MSSPVRALTPEMPQAIQALQSGPIDIIGDVHGEALAYNCVGVDYMKLGEIDPIFFNDAIQYHMKHKEIADVAGKFLAHINLGIIYNMVGDYEKSSINH